MPAFRFSGFAGILCIVMSFAAMAAPVRNVRVPMTDGTMLLTDYQLPQGTGPFPVVLQRTPYPRTTWFGIGMDAAHSGRWLEQGFAVVVQNLRGSYGSGSEDRNEWHFYNEGWSDVPDEHFHPDANDCVQWVRAQPWCNGTIITYGGSAPGIASELLAGATQDIAGQIMLVSGPNFYHNLGREGGVIRREQMDWYILEGCPQIIDDVEAHPYYDDYWARFNATAPDRVQRITAPGLHMGGWFDTFAEGTIESFCTRQQDGGEGARGNQKLIMEPVSHMGTLGFAIDFPDSTFPLKDQYERAFLARWGQTQENNFDALPNVNYYVMGAVGESSAPGNEWRTANEWPPAASTTIDWFLHSDHTLSRVSPQAKSTDRLVFRYDPNDPCPTEGGRTLFPQDAFETETSSWFAGPQDQRTVSRRADVLRFETPALVRPFEATGTMKVDLFVSTDVPDTDFTVKLVDIYPDGREILILDTIQRVKLRHGYEAPDPLPAGTIGELIVKLGNTSIAFNQGHRIGLQVSSSNYPRFEVNPNNGDDLPGAHPSPIATNVVYMGAVYASSLTLMTPDADQDTVADYDEAAYGTNPNDADTDRDGRSDRDEIDAGTDPILPEGRKADFDFVASDGARIATSYRVPAGVPPFPVMLARTPQGMAALAEDAARWLNNRYAVVLQDVRGTGASEDTGTAVFETDGWGPVSDSEEIVAWIAGQAWCDGHIGTFGAFAVGACSMLAGGASQEITAQSIEFAPASFYGQWAYQGGVPRSELFTQWDSTGTWRANPSYDAFWTHHDAVARAPAITAAGLHVGGWFDAFSQGTIDNFTSRQHEGGAGPSGNQFLIIGPTAHDGGSGQLAFPDATLSPGIGLFRRDFFDHYMKGRGGTPPSPVTYYMMGAVGEPGAFGNEWRYADNWPPYAIAHRHYYLAPGGELSTGRVVDTFKTTYHYDPDNPVPTLGGANLATLDGVAPGPADQRAVADPLSGGARADVVTFLTPPLDAPVEIAGPVRVRLYVASTAEDTDFTAKLLDVYPDGREMLFTDGIQRLAYQNGFDHPEPLTPGTIAGIEIDLWSTALVFNQGHRIGVSISSSNAPRFEPNPVEAENTIYFGGARPSALLLPLKANVDADKDGLSEAGEAAAGTDPFGADTDGDGCGDGDEVNDRTDPLDPLSRIAECGTGPEYFYLTTYADGQGTIDVDAGSLKATPYPRGSQLLLTAVADDGWHFDSWSGDIDSTSDNPLATLMDRDRSIEATFIEDSAEGEGEGEGEPPCWWCCSGGAQGASGRGFDMDVIALASVVGVLARACVRQTGRRRS